mgnify:CR=1 FL=1
MSNMYRCRPSKLLAIEEDYAAYCLDEACMYVQMQIDDGKKPMFVKQYKSFTDVYKDLKKGGVMCQ